MKSCSLLPLALVLLFPVVAGAKTTYPEKGNRGARRLTVQTLTQADYTRHLLKLRKKVPAGFSLVVQPPFVVLGDEPPATLRSLASGIVKWAVDRLKQDYFSRDPQEILDIWLFKNKESYNRYNRELFGEEPQTPFGYYSPEHKALIMNIGTGGGTLVHEIVHPFMAANFPQCPAWFNEGMGSLYEQCGDKGGHIYGYTNWRLPGLQQAIQDHAVPSFQTLMSMDSNTFYNKDTGLNYGQSRYLCYYLQEQGLLKKYYQQFSTHWKADPTGLNTLRRVLGEPDLSAFQKRWEAFVLKLNFP